MPNRSFSGRLKVENKILRICALFQLVSLSLVIGFLFAGTGKMLTLLWTVGFLALLVNLTTFVVLIIRYRTHPLTIEKSSLRAEQARLDAQLISAQTRLKQVFERQITQQTGQDQLRATRRQHVSLMHWQDNLTARIQQYNQVNPAEFLLAALQPTAASDSIVPSRLNHASVGLIPLLILTSMFCQGAAALVTIGAIHLDTSATNTPTSILTPSGKLTLTGTLIHTPTSTTAPTEAVTPTITRTPTITPTPTGTGTSTITIPALANFNCISSNAPRQIGRVTRVIDGDTIEVRVDGNVFPVRYIGIDTPERGEPYGYEAAVANNKLVDGQIVFLFKDVSETDAYDRLLRYVFVGDTFVNFELIKSGDARSSAYPPDTACQSLFDQIQGQAQSAALGFWALIPTSPPVVKPAAGKSCAPAYPGVCIKPPPPDLDCKDIPFRRFQVLPPDPHHFDGDGDGIGCER